MSSKVAIEEKILYLNFLLDFNYQPQGLSVGLEKLQN